MIFEGLTLYPRLACLPGQEFADVLEEPKRKMDWSLPESSISKITHPFPSGFRPFTFSGTFPASGSCSNMRWWTNFYLVVHWQAWKAHGNAEFPRL